MNVWRYHRRGRDNLVKSTESCSILLKHLIINNLCYSIVVYEGGSVMSQARSLWRLELARTKWSGGFINWYHPMRIRHLTTGRYLGVNDNNELILVRHASPVLCGLFKPIDILAFERRSHNRAICLLLASRKRRPEDCAWRQRSGSDRIADHQIRWLDSHRPACRKQPLAELQKLRDEKEGRG